MYPLLSCPILPHGGFTPRREASARSEMPHIFFSLAAWKKLKVSRRSSRSFVITKRHSYGSWESVTTNPLCADWLGIVQTSGFSAISQARDFAFYTNKP